MLMVEDLKGELKGISITQRGRLNPKYYGGSQRRIEVV